MIIDCYCTIGDERETVQTSERLLQQMRASGVSRAVIAPQDREIAVRNRDGNDRMLSIASDHPAELVPACTANPWFGNDAVNEMQRSVRAGAKMLVLAPAVQGFMLSDDLTDDLLNEAGKIRLPVYVHTGPQSHSAPSQLALVAQKHQNTRFIMGHCGSTDHAWDMPSILHLKLPNLWFETSFVRPWVVTNYAAIAGDDRLIFGSSSPRNDLRMELTHLKKHWPVAEHPATYGQTLGDLLSEVIHDR